MQDHHPGESHGNAQPVRRPYEAPALTELGTVAQLTQQPPSNPSVGSELTGTQVFFLGDDA
jgi:hypothetical protein